MTIVKQIQEVREGDLIPEPPDYKCCHAASLMPHLFPVERFSNECRKTKTKVITPANHNRHKLSNEPIRTRSKYMLLASSAGKNVRARASRD